MGTVVAAAGQPGTPRAAVSGTFPPGRAGAAQGGSPSSSMPASPGLGAPLPLCGSCPRQAGKYHLLLSLQPPRARLAAEGRNPEERGHLAAF